LIDDDDDDDDDALEIQVQGTQRTPHVVLSGWAEVVTRGIQVQQTPRTPSSQGTLVQGTPRTPPSIPAKKTRPSWGNDAAWESDSDDEMDDKISHYLRFAQYN
jgi:hypothetical protein